MLEMTQGICSIRESGEVRMIRLNHEYHFQKIEAVTAGELAVLDTLKEVVRGGDKEALESDLAALKEFADASTVVDPFSPIRNTKELESKDIKAMDEIDCMCHLYWHEYPDNISKFLHKATAENCKLIERAL